MAPEKANPPRDKLPVIVLLTILAPLLGGSTKLWAQAALALITGALFLFSPPRKSLGLIPNIAFSILFFWALTAFLPAAWFPTPEWRAKLTAAGAILPLSVSAQPWIT